MKSKNTGKTDLIYDEFKKYEATDVDYNGFEMFGDSFNHRFYFENGYGASVIKHYGSYGYEKDLFELAVIIFDDETEEWHLCFDTPITDDVIGYLTNEEVLDLLRKIKNLKEK